MISKYILASFAADSGKTRIQQAGYRIIPISELLLEGDTWIDHAGTQHLATPAPSARRKRKQRLNQKRLSNKEDVNNGKSRH